MRNKFTLTMLMLLVAVFAFAGSGGHKRKVLVIGIDGCRADALKQEMDSGHAPNLLGLCNTGFYSLDSWHLDITVSGPSWSSIMCGVYHEKHGVTGNTYGGSNYNQYPYFPTHAKEIDTSFKCVQYTEWAPMSNNVYNDGWDQKIIGTDGYSQGTGTAAAGLIQDPNTDLLFTYFDKVDLTGHSSGFNPNNPAYTQAIDSIDFQIGRILQAMRSRPTYAQEDWLVLITTDHGGTGTGHGGISYEERHIWWIANSDRGVHLQVSGPQNAGHTTPPDPGTFLAYPVTKPDTALQHQSPVQVDIATTALHHLIYNSRIRPETQSAWALDGRSWLCEIGLCDSLGTLGVHDASATLVSRVVPNPSADGRFSVSFENEGNKDACLIVTDALGKNVRKDYTDHSSSYMLDLSGVAKGLYYLTIIVGDRTSTHKIVRD
jgi:hypothetical protein